MAPPLLHGTLSWVTTSHPLAMHTGGITRLVLCPCRLMAAGLRPSRSELTPHQFSAGFHKVTFLQRQTEPWHHAADVKGAF